MHNRNWKQEILTIPNLLSLFRLLLIPVYTQLYLQAQSDLDYYVAGSVLILSCLTDLADGRIARQYHMVSDFGKLLDPLADKLTQLSLLLCVSGRYAGFLPLLILFLTKEFFQLGMMVLFLRRGKVLSGALFAGKLCTTVLFVSMILLVLFPRIPDSAVRMLIRLDSAFLLYAFYSYLYAYFGAGNRLTDLKRE